MMIIVYNTIEPILVASSLSICFQLCMLSSAVYLAITMIGIFPFILSEKRGHVKCKQILSACIAGLDILAICFKAFFYHVYSNKTLNQNKINELNFFGIWPNQEFKTFSVDVCQLVVSVALIYHYSSQLLHLDQKEKLGSRYDYQTDFKFLHPTFGRKHDRLYIVVLIVYLADSLCLLTFV